MSEFFHSVTLDEDLCHGCINCVKRCPTEAIRVRNGKAKILSDRCIDCGECIRICPHHAKKPIFDPLSVMDQYEYTVALPAPSLYGQFNNLDDVEIILRALIDMGFDAIFEVSRAAELVSDATRKMLSEGQLPRPVISSACPAVVRLVRVRFPDLIQHLLPLQAPVEVAARLAKKEAVERTGLPPEKIGCIFISPCAAKVTAVKMPLGTRKSAIDAVVAIRDVYPQMLRYMKEGAGAGEEYLSSGRMGIGWGSSGGESAALLNDRYLAADGIENVIRVLEDLEDEKLGSVDFVELNACSGGCVGGVLTVENPYIAKAKLKRVRKYLPVSCNRVGDDIPRQMKFDQEIQYEPVLQLDEDITVALRKLSQIEEISHQFSGLDCAACGAPSCKALAEDVVRGYNTPDACVFLLKDKIQSLANAAGEREEKIPAASLGERQK